MSVTPTITFPHPSTDFEDGDPANGIKVWENLEAIKTAYDTHTHSPTTSEWFLTSDTITITSSTTFTVAGDKRSTYFKGAMLKIIDSGGTKYGVIASNSYSTSTTVTLLRENTYGLSGTATAVYVCYGLQPYDFPSTFTLTPTLSKSGAGTLTTNSASIYWQTAGTMINLTFSFNVTITVSTLTYISTTMPASSVLSAGAECPMPFLGNDKMLGAYVNTLGTNILIYNSNDSLSGSTWGTGTYTIYGSGMTKF